MMEDYDRTLELVETAQNSKGRSDEQFAKYADTMTYKINKLKNSWEELRVSFLGSDDYKKGLDFANAFLDQIKKIDPKMLIVDIGVFAILGTNIISGIVNSLQDNTPKVQEAYNKMVDRLSIDTILDKDIQKYATDFASKFKIELDENNIQMPDVQKIVSKFQPYIEIRTNAKQIELDLEDVQNQLIDIQQEVNEKSKGKNLTDEQFNKLREFIALNQDLTKEELIQEAKNKNIIEYKNQISGLTREQINLIASLTNEENNLNATYSQEQQKLEQIKLELKQHGYDMQNIERLTNQEVIKLGEQLTKEQQITEQKRQQLQNTRQMLGKQVGKQLSSAAINAVTSGLTAGILAGISTGDWGAAFKTGAMAAFSSIIPQLIDIVTKGIVALLGAVTPLVATGIVGVAAIAGVAAYAMYTQTEEYAYKKRKKELEQEAKEIEERLNKAGEKLSKDKEKRDEYKGQKKSLQELKKVYEDYSKNIVHTQEEQKKYQETLADYAEDFPDLISLQNGQYEVQNSLLREQIKLIDEKLKKTNLQYAIDQLEINEGERENAQTTYDTEQTDINYGINNLPKLINKVKSSWYEDESGRHYDAGLFGVDFNKNIKQLTTINEQTNGELEKYYNKYFNTDVEFDKLAKLSSNKRHEILENLMLLNSDEIDKMIEQIEKEANDEIEDQFNESIEQYSDNNERIIKDNLIANGIDGAIADYLFSTIDDLKDFCDHYEEEIVDLENRAENLKGISGKIADIDDSNLTIAELKEIAENGKNAKVASKEGKEIVQLFNQTQDEEQLKYLESQYNNKYEAGLSSQKTLSDLTPNVDIFNTELLSKKQIDAFASRLSELLETIPEYMRESFLQSTENIKTVATKDFGIDEETFQNALIAIEWGNLTLTNYEQWQEEWVRILKESGYNAEEATAIFDGIVKQYQDSGAITIGFNDPEEFQEELDKQKEAIENSLNEEVYQISVKPIGAELSPTEIEDLAEYLSDQGEDIFDYIDLDTQTFTKDLSSYYQAQTEKPLQSMQRTLQNIYDVAGAQSKDALKEFGKESGKELLEWYGEIKKKQEEGQVLNEKEKDFWENYAPSLADAYDQASKEIKTRNQAIITLYIQRQKELEALVESEKDNYEELNDIYEKAKDAQDKYIKAQEDEQEEIQEALDKINDALEKVAEQEDTILEKEQDIVEKTKELNEALYGTENYLSSRDSLQNYTDRIDQLSEIAEKAKDALDNPEVEDNISELVKTYGEAIHQEMVYQDALNKRKEDQKNQILGYLQGFGSEYFTMVDGYLQANYSAIDNARMNDQLKDQIYDYLDSYNQVQKEIIEGEEKYSDLLKEMKDRRKDALNDLVDLQRNTADILKESYEKEIEDVKEKYDAIKEADDEYLSALEDAINKQRQLREQENKWNDLATKEKKLSLMQRDTSGTQQKEVLKLEQEIQDDRQSLLDSSIDSILETLKETYEEQQKEREEELEYQEQILEDMDFMRQAIELLSTMNSNEDYLSWLMQTDPAYIEGSEYEQEQYLLEHENDFAALQTYYDFNNANFQNYLNITAEEVEQAMAATSDNLNDYLERSHQTTINNVLEEQQTAQDALNQAYEDLDDAIAKLGELQTAVNDAKLNYSNAVTSSKEKTEEARKSYEDAMDSVYKKGATSVEDMQTKVTDAFNKYNESQANAETELLKYKNNLLSYLDFSVEALDILAQSETKADFNQKVDKLQSAFDGIDRANNVVVQRNAYVGSTTEPDINIMEGFAQQIAAAIGPAAQVFNLKVDENGFYRKYAAGGLVNYTGPAWVDGSPTHPEAFLSAEDTARIGAAAQLLSNIPALNSSSIDNSYSSNIGDTTIEVHINVENISSEVDIDEAVKRVEDDIVQMSNSIGKSIYLNK